MLPEKLNLSVTVSLTSFPARISFVPQVIASVLNQTVRPDRVVLWLAESQFAGREKDLPQELVELTEKGLEINWCEDLRPHKKYFYTMQKYPDDIIITVDDDVVYQQDLVETLLNSFFRHPYAVSAMRAHCITFDGQGNINPYALWERGVRLAGYPSHALLAVGVGGVLYPPHCFGSELFNREFIVENCLNADDLWLKANEIISNVPVVLAAASAEVKNIKGSQTEALYKSNDLGDCNDRQFENIMNHCQQLCSGGYTVYDRLYISAAAIKSSSGGQLSDSYAKLMAEENAKIKASASYKIGRAVTALPRAVKALVMCIADNGFGYTVKLVLKRLGM